MSEQPEKPEDKLVDPVPPGEKPLTLENQQLLKEKDFFTLGNPAYQPKPPPPPKKRKFKKKGYTEEQYARALKNAKGFPASAAAWLEDHYGRRCSPRMVLKAIKDYPKLKALVFNFEETRLEDLKKKMFDEAMGGNCHMMMYITTRLKTAHKYWGTAPKQVDHQHKGQVKIEHTTVDKEEQKKRLEKIKGMVAESQVELPNGLKELPAPLDAAKVIDQVPYQSEGVSHAPPKEETSARRETDTGREQVRSPQ